MQRGESEAAVSSDQQSGAGAGGATEDEGGNGRGHQRGEQSYQYGPQGRHPAAGSPRDDAGEETDHGVVGGKGHDGGIERSPHQRAECSGGHPCAGSGEGGDQDSSQAIEVERNGQRHGADDLADHNVEHKGDRDER